MLSSVPTVDEALWRIFRNSFADSAFILISEAYFEVMQLLHLAETAISSDYELEEISECWPILVPSGEVRQLDPGQRGTRCHRICSHCHQCDWRIGLGQVAGELHFII